MKNLIKFRGFVNEWLDSPGSVDVPGEAYQIRANRRNYQSIDPTMPQIVDAMFEAAYFHDFLDEEGKSEKFNKFLSEKNKSGSDVAEYLKTSFQIKNSKEKQ
jgi:hypothetical protein